jgi:hypothetical protein
MAQRRTEDAERLAELEVMSYTLRHSIRILAHERARVNRQIAAERMRRESGKPAA